IGLPLNRMLTIHFSKIVVVGPEQRRIGRMLERARKYLARRDVPLTAVWVMERKVSSKPHCHLLIHLPNHIDEAAFMVKVADWLGGSVNDGALDLRRSWSGGCRGYRYVLKDVDPSLYAEFQLPNAWIPKRSDRPLEGKRSGTTQNIG